MSELSTADSDRLERILASWFDALEAGDDPDLDSLCDQAPHLREHVERLIKRESALSSALSECANSATDSPPESFDEVGDFELIEPLGEGGAGRVFRAHDRSLDREVAVKVLREGRRDAQQQQRFRREASITAALEHPNIVPIYAVGDASGRSFMAMKLLSGPPLDSLPRGTSTKQIAEIGARIADALHEAHVAGVIHRDVKPGNVILDGATPYILDFGLAFAIDDSRLTQEGAVPGTLAYMSPEQLRGGHHLDARTDVYSLGATLYEALSGHPPFESQPPSLMHDILERDPARLRDVEEELETIVLRAMNKDPRQRFATAAEFAADLNRFVRGEPIESKPPSIASRTLRLAHRYRVMVVAAACVSIIALVAAAVQWNREMRVMAAADARCDELEVAIERGDLLVASMLLTTLEREGVHGERATALRSSFDARRALDDLVRAVTWRRSDLRSADRIARIVEKIEGSGGRDADLRQPIPTLALALADGLAGDSESARHRLTRLQTPTRGSIAITAWLDGREPHVALEDARTEACAAEPALDRIFAARAIWLADGPIAAQRNEVLAALAIDERDSHVRHALGRVLHEEGNHTGAIAAFDSIVARPSLHRDIARCSIAFEELALGRLDQAIARVSQIESDDGPVRMRKDLIRLHVAAKRNAPDLISRIEQSIATWPGQAEFHRLAANVYESAGRYEDAMRAHGRVLATRLRASERRRVRADRLEVRLRRFVTSKDPLEREREEIQRVATTLTSQARSAGDDRTAAAAMYARGVVSLERDSCVAHLEEAIRLRPQLYRARLFLIDQALQTHQTTGDAIAQLDRAEEHARYILERRGHRADQAHPDQANRALLGLAFIAYLRRRWNDVQRYAGELLDIGYEVERSTRLMEMANRNLGR